MWPFCTARPILATHFLEGWGGSSWKDGRGISMEGCERFAVEAWMALPPNLLNTYYSIMVDEARARRTPHQILSWP